MRGQVDDLLGQIRERVAAGERVIAVSDTVRDYLLVPSVIMQWMFPVVITFAIYLFLRGHDLPGGGFAGGVTMAIAFLLQYLAGGVRWAEDRLRILPLRWMGFGLLMAATTGMGAWFFGYPFLTAHAQYLDLPVIGNLFRNKSRAKTKAELLIFVTPKVMRVAQR